MDSILLIPVWMSISALILGIGLVTFIGISLHSYGFFEAPNKKPTEEDPILTNGNNNHSEGVISEKPLLSHEMTKNISPVLPTNDTIPRIKVINCYNHAGSPNSYFRLMRQAMSVSF